MAAQSAEALIGSVPYAAANANDICPYTAAAAVFPLYNGGTAFLSPSRRCLPLRRDTMEMGFDEKFALLRSIAEECIREDELRVLLKKKPNPICYGIMKTIYVNKMVRAGCTVKILIADWFLQRNPRFTCNLNKIQAIIRYNIMMWKAVGMHLDKVEIIWFSDELNHHAVDYWPLAMDVS
uniref:Tyrosine--tRNA ligase n=1 Tax=Oryza meridionalis TaxID=40149 RepID=A0A0E0DK98_9ORYZ